MRLMPKTLEVFSSALSSGSIALIGETMAKSDPPINFEITRQRRIRAICHRAVDYDQNNVPREVNLKTSKEFLEAFNNTAVAILLRALDSACQHGRTTVRPEDIPSLRDMGLNDPQDLRVDMANMSLVG